ncbi:mite group 2 allergen-like Ixo r 2 isoform X1 [Amblyomma americanum]
MVLLAAAVLFFGLALGDRADIKYEKCCEPPTAFPAGCLSKDLSLQIGSCNYDSCILDRNTTIQIKFVFTSGKFCQNTTDFFLDATISSWADIMMPFPGLEYNLCHRLLKCPLVENKRYTWTMEIPAPDFVNPGERILRLRSVGDRGTMFCANVNVTLN